MPTADDLLRLKDNSLYTIEPDASVLEATRVMNAQHIGAILVMKAKRLLGIFTERDVLTRVVSQGLDPHDTSVGEVMSAQVICCEGQTDLEEIALTMRARRIRHLPVCAHDGSVIGLVSIGDLNAFHVSHQQATIEGLCRYIHQRA